MNSNTPRDELIERYEQAKAALPDGLPDAPPAALHERIMRAAREQANATKTVAPRADSMPATSQKILKTTPEAANDSFWYIKLVASLAVMGLTGLLWWQFEHGTPEEQEAAKSAKPRSTVVAAAPSPAPAAAPAAAPEASPAPAPEIASTPAPAKSATPSAPAAARKEAQFALSKSASAELATPSAASKPAPIPEAANTGSAMAEPARARVQDPTPAIAAAPAPAPAPVAAPAIPEYSQTDKAIATDVPSRRASSGVGAEPSLQRSLETAQTPSAAYVAPPPAPVAAARAAPAPAPAPAAIASNPSPLFAAIQSRDAAALRQALNQGTSPNARNPEGNPGLHQAVIQRWPEGVRILLAAGADRNAKNSKGHTASDVALELGYADMADLVAISK